MKKTLLITFIIGALSHVGFAQNFDKSKLDKYFTALEANNKFMGSVALSKDGEIIYARTVGFSNTGTNTKANENTKYRIGSISKTFTAVLILKAVEDRKLDLDQTIEPFFPTIRNAGKITIKHLLSHRSGIHSFTDDQDYLTWNTQPRTEKELVGIIAKAESEFEPDSKAAYSNSNYILLSYILEKTYKKPYAALLQEKITKPLGLTNTYFGREINTKKNEAKSYSFENTWKEEPETDTSIPLGAGGIISTPRDLTKFSDALFSGRLLKSESLEQMKTTQDNLGLGLFQVPFNNKTGYGHTGGIDGFSSVFSYFPDGNISYALTSNGSQFNNNNISIAVLSAVYDRPYAIPEFAEYSVSSEDLIKYLGVYSSKDMPLKITVTKDDTTLKAQATGQPAFPLEATEKDKFKFEQAGVVLEFNPRENTMLLKQGGGKFTFKKEQ